MTTSRLTDLGWNAHFADQIGPDDAGLIPFRISEVQRARAIGMGDGDTRDLGFPNDIAAGSVAVGDWALVDPETQRITRVLGRQSLLQRKAAGIEIKPQLIAANVDTLFITSSCNDDFNISRLERYVAMALEADCTPVVVLTKADQCPDTGPYISQTQAISPKIADVIALNAKDMDHYAPLRAHIAPGRTMAFIGSSGVGKSTMIKRLTGVDIATAAIREDDAKGRHTTTHRALYELPGGGLVIDMPGMRELALVDAAGGIDDLFDDIVTLGNQCKFRDCAHEGEPGCAIRTAIDDGTLDPDRYARFQKLRAEDAYHSSSVHEARAKGRAFGRMVKDVKKIKRDRFRR